MKPQPRVQRPIRPWMAYPARQKPRPDSAWRDAAVVGVAILFLLFVYLAPTWMPVWPVPK